MGQICRASGPAIVRGGLTWWPLGVGWLPVADGIAPYDHAYFNKYVGYAATERGRQLTQARIDFVARHYRGVMCDVGIGCGAFIEARPELTYGHDVCPTALRWLYARGRLANPYKMPFDAISLWDVLEHIPDFPRLFRRVRQYVFVALPIFRDIEHALGSRHFRPTEHCWYFTAEGLIAVMGELGFDLVERNEDETAIGREDIASFAFKRT